MSTTVNTRCFPLPSSLKVIPGTETAQAAYPYYMQFAKEDDERFWFYNSMHFPEPMTRLRCHHRGSRLLRLGRGQHARAQSADDAGN